jgi:hypothetical protein
MKSKHTFCWIDYASYFIDRYHPARLSACGFIEIKCRIGDSKQEVWYV